MTVRRSAIRIAAAALALGIAGCASQPHDTAPPSREPEPGNVPWSKAEPRSRFGNGPVYEVLGQRYEVLGSSIGYVERGIASWYGRKFHGRPTSSREPYDMHAMSAAHKTLPLPTWVEVRNLENDRSIVVRVNDRGPFVKNRLIDLSYAAAVELDMIRHGTAMVEVRALGNPVGVGSVEENHAGTDLEAPVLFLQVGAFGDRANAERRHRLLADNGIDGVAVQHDDAGTPPVYRVRIGPLGGVAEYDRVIGELSRMGIRDTQLVTD